MNNFENKRDKGGFYEEKAAEYLRKKGYNIITMNFNTRFGEIDIVAEDRSKPLVVFVEVKARDKNKGVHPFEAVDERKQRRIILAAQEYMMINHVENSYIRFDVVGVITDGDRIESIEIAQDAFQAG